MRDIIDKIDAVLAEKSDKTLKTQAINAVRATDDEKLLQKVIDTLSAGNIEDRIENVIGKDQDAKKFLSRIADLIIKIKAPIEEKNKFLEDYPKGILDTSRLLDGQLHSFSELVGPGFNTELFKAMITEFSSQGVGPGEVALAVMSPTIRWSGRAAGGGDIKVGDIPVEVKTTVEKGGRWINARKATMDMPEIKRAISDAITKSTGNAFDAFPQRINAKVWVDDIRPLINPKLLPAMTKVMSDGLFNHANNKDYQTALMSGSAEDIRDAVLKVGFENYKNYSGFDGILMMNLGGESAQYFKDYNSMKGKIKSDLPYVYAPEQEAMPKVSLTSLPGGALPSGPTQSDDVTPVPSASVADFKPARSKIQAYQKPTDDEKSLGRKRRR